MLRLQRSTATVAAQQNQPRDDQDDGCGEEHGGHHARELPHVRGANPDAEKIHKRYPDPRRNPW